jgi:hypothetical protein
MRLLPSGPRSLISLLLQQLSRCSNGRGRHWPRNVGWDLAAPLSKSSMLRCASICLRTRPSRMTLPALLLLPLSEWNLRLM